MSLELAQFILSERSQKTHLRLNIPLVRSWAEEIISLIYPQRGHSHLTNLNDATRHISQIEETLKKIIESLESIDPELNKNKEQITKDFFHKIPAISLLLDSDAKAALEGDPAAKSLEEVIVSYPGFWAICIYRVSSAMCQLNIPLIPRVLSEYAHEKTGVEIHPGAKIGHSFFIDHGTGVVIGETSEIGNNVKIYQGVTLGALSVRKDMKASKRHPTIEDDVVIYANATILGGKTVVGSSSVIGGSVWLTKSVPTGSKIFLDKT